MLGGRAGCLQPEQDEGERHERDMSAIIAWRHSLPERPSPRHTVSVRHSSIAGENFSPIERPASHREKSSLTEAQA